MKFYKIWRIYCGVYPGYNCSRIYNETSVIPLPRDVLFQWDLAELKQRLLVKWRKLDHSIVVAAISQWHHHLSACDNAHSGHGIEHILWCFHGTMCQVNAENFFEFGVLLFDCFVYRQNVTCLKCFTRYGHYTGEVKDVITGRLAFVS